MIKELVHMRVRELWIGGSGHVHRLGLLDLLEELLLHHALNMCIYLKCCLPMLRWIAKVGVLEAVFSVLACSLR